MKDILPFIKAHKVIAILVFLLAVFFLLRIVLLQKPNTELTYTVKRENLVDTVQVSGGYTTASQTSVMSPTNGVITKLFVTNGETVEKDQQLFYVESSATEDQRKAAYAAYLAANSALAADNATLYSLQSSMYTAWQSYMNQATSSTYQNGDGSANTTSRVETQFTVPQTAWLSAEQQFKNQQAVIAKDQAALSSAKLSYDETQNVLVKAPLGGTIANLSANLGDQVAVGTITPNGVNTAAPVLMVVNLANPYISASISEDYAAQINTGQKVSVVFDALKEKTFNGSVVHVDTVGTTTNGVVTYATKIAIDHISPQIKPNMTALITIETLRKNNIITVPNSAITVKDNIAYVVKAGTNGKTLVPVFLGTKGTTKTEILKGLEEGAVIAANPH